MLLVWPVLVQIALTLGVGLATAVARFSAARRGEVKLREIALDNRFWPERARKFGNNYANQFELPVLFYVLTGLAIHLGQDHLAMATAAWGFVVSRFLHMAVHIGRNDVRQRFLVFGLSYLFVMAMFLMVAASLIASLL